jgi:flagellar biosynthesis protein FliR
MLWLGHFLWPFLRITGLFVTSPLFGSSMIPNAV